MVVGGWSSTGTATHDWHVLSLSFLFFSFYILFSLMIHCSGRICGALILCFFLFFFPLSLFAVGYCSRGRLGVKLAVTVWECLCVCVWVRVSLLVTSGWRLCGCGCGCGGNGGVHCGRAGHAGTLQDTFGAGDEVLLYGHLMFCPVLCSTCTVRHFLATVL